MYGQLPILYTYSHISIFFTVLILYFTVIMYLNYTQTINTKPERLLKVCILSTLIGTCKWQFHVWEMIIHQSSIPSTISSIWLKMIVWKKNNSTASLWAPLSHIKDTPPLLAAFEKILTRNKLNIKYGNFWDGLLITMQVQLIVKNIRICKIKCRMVSNHPV